MRTKKNFLLSIDKQDWILITFAVWFTVGIIFKSTMESVVGIPKETINSVVNVCVVLMLMVQIVIWQRYTRGELLLIVAITALLLISALNCKYLYLVSTWMFIVAAKEVNYEQLVRLQMRIVQICVPFVIILCSLGILEDRTIYRGSELRHSLGFVHPNILGLRIFQWAVCYVYLMGERTLKSFEIVFLLLGIFFVYQVPNAQTAVASLALLLVGELLFQLLKERSVLKKYFSKLIIVVTLLINFGSICLSMIDLAKYPLMKKLDMFLSLRFSEGHKLYVLHGLSWLGQEVYVSEAEGKYLDNAYMTLLVRYGILVYLLFTICFFLLLLKLYRMEKFKLLNILALYAVYGIMSNSLYTIEHNIFIVMMGILLYRRKSVLGGQVMDGNVIRERNQRESKTRLKS